MDVVPLIVLGVLVGGIYLWMRIEEHTERRNELLREEERQYRIQLEQEERRWTRKHNVMRRMRQVARDHHRTEGR
ncbi:hypothetical protein [Streptomyces sp. bgisy034]|uniref:hypothetical protein n=1 Tax=Streptomyces sp. bgisy034 TaxID=3413774 RepID=UPI003EBCE4FC